MRPTFSINGVDYAKKINKFSYEVGYEKVLGKNSGTMKNGDYTEDLIKWRVVLTLTTNAMTAAEAKALLQALTEKELAITYNDERSGSVRTVWCTVELGRNRIALYEGGKLVWSEGMTIKLKEARSYE